MDLHDDRPGERNRRLRLVCERILKLTGPTAPPPAPTAASPGAQPAAPRPAGGSAGNLHGVPELPPAFVVRDEIKAVRAMLLSPERATVVVTGRVPGIGVGGQGGFGKTVVAAAVARDPRVREAFPDGVFWVTLGQDADLLTAQLRLLA